MKSIPQFQITFQVHNKSAVIGINSGKIVPGKVSGNSRGNVTVFSYRSERRMRLALEDTFEVWKNFAVTTYPGEFPCDGRKVKRDIQALNRWFKRQGVKDIFWGLEFQRRGAPHINFLISSDVDKDKLAAAWYKIVGSGDERHLRAGTGIEAIRGKESVSSYMIGYLGKRWQKDVPIEYANVGRFWGCTRSVQSRGTYTYRFASQEALNAFLRPVVNEYQVKMKEWSQKSKKPYTWQYRGNGFVMWSGSDFITKYLMEVKQHDETSYKGVGSQNGIVQTGKRSLGLHTEGGNDPAQTPARLKRYRIFKSYHL